MGIYSSSILGIVLLKFYINWKFEAEVAQGRIAVVCQQNNGEN